MEDESLQLDETALCFLKRLHNLYEDAHAWFQDIYRIENVPGSEKFLRLTDIAHERDQVSRDLAEHITYVLLAETPYTTGTPGINLEIALRLKALVISTQMQDASEDEIVMLHNMLRYLDLIEDQ